MMWADFSAWLVTGGRDHGRSCRHRRVDRFSEQPIGPGQPAAWPHFIGNVVVLILATLNMLVHTHDAWTSVVPWGLALSAAGGPVAPFHRLDGLVHGLSVPRGSVRAMIALPTNKRACGGSSVQRVLALAGCNDDRFDPAKSDRSQPKPSRAATVSVPADASCLDRRLERRARSRRSRRD